MEDTAYYTLPDLEWPVGPRQAVAVRLAGPILLQVDFVYEKGAPARSDAPAVPELFDFKRIITPHALVLASPDTNIRTVICSGTEMYEHLTDPQLEQIEADLMQRHRDGRHEAALDALLVTRLMAGLEGAP